MLTAPTELLHVNSDAPQDSLTLGMFACRYAKLRPRFATTRDPPFVSRVFLPNNSAVTAATGLPYPHKDTARASACLVACRLLHKVGVLPLQIFFRCLSRRVQPGVHVPVVTVITCRGQCNLHSNRSRTCEAALA